MKTPKSLEVSPDVKGQVSKETPQVGSDAEKLSVPGIQSQLLLLRPRRRTVQDTVVLMSD